MIYTKDSLLLTSKINLQLQILRLYYKTDILSSWHRVFILYTQRSNLKYYINQILF